MLLFERALGPWAVDELAREIGRGRNDVRRLAMAPAPNGRGSSFGGRLRVGVAYRRPRRSATRPGVRTGVVHVMATTEAWHAGRTMRICGAVGFRQPVGPTAGGGLARSPADGAPSGSTAPRGRVRHRQRGPSADVLANYAAGRARGPDRGCLAVGASRSAVRRADAGTDRRERSPPGSQLWLRTVSRSLRRCRGGGPSAPTRARAGALLCGRQGVAGVARPLAGRVCSPGRSSASQAAR